MPSSGEGAGGPTTNARPSRPRSRPRSASLLQLLTLSGLLMLGCLHSAGSAATGALGGTSRTCGGAGPGSLEVALVDDARAASLALSICDWFRDEPFRVEFVESARFGSGDVRAPGVRQVSVLLESEREARLYIVPPGAPGAVGGGQRWVRSIALSAGLDEAGVEVIAQALHSTVLATELGFTEPERDAPVSARKLAGTAKKTPARALHRARLPVRTALGYHFYARGPEPLTHGPALRVELDWQDLPLSWGAFARASAFTSGHTRAGGLDVSLSGASLGAGLCASAPLSKLIGRVALGGNVDLLGLDVQVIDPDALRLTGHRRARPRAFVGMEAGLNLPMGDLALAFAGLLRWQLSASHYDILEGQELSTVIVPWRLQPGASLELAYVW